MFPSRIGTRLHVRTFRVPMFVIAAALIVLIAVLATLQYRWLGRISDAERERMTSNLGAHSTALAQDFDQELTRAYAIFQLELSGEQESLAAKLTARHDRWMATARHPRMVRDVYIARHDGAAPALQRYSATSKFIEPVEWPAALTPVRDAVAKAMVRHAETTRSLPTTFVFTTMPPQAQEQVPALVIPMPILFINSLDPNSRPGSSPRVALDGLSAFVIVHLDREYIANEMLPAMVDQRFRSAGTAYQVAVVNAKTKDVVYTSDRAFAPAPDAKADATADLFQVRLQEFGGLVSEIRRFTTAATIHAPVVRGEGTERRAATIRRPEVAESLEIHRLETPSRSGTPNPPVSIMVQQSLDARERSAVVSGASAALSRSAQSGPRWRLVVKHPSGSLEAAVNTARRRNILVSSSVMALLGISVGFLIVTTRRAQELARQQMEFVAAVSHELRTPLAVIRSAADNLAEGVVQDHPQVKKYGDLVRVEGRRLSEMVEQILELAGIHSGQRSFALRPVAVLPLLHDVVRSSSTLIDDAGLDVQMDIPDTLPAVLGEEAALRRVFQNLLGNAIKYGASGRWIGITGRLEGREVVISVADRGIGIPSAEHARIFDAFYRAPNVVDAQIQGAGLGLSLVQRIVEAHGGRIKVQSAEGTGSEFSVHLPAASEEAVPQTSSTPDPAHRVS